MLSKNVLLYGREEPLSEQTPLRAGPLTLIHEAGDLRYIKLGDCEILRRVYVAVRDRNWSTVPPVLSNIRIDACDNAFHITYHVAHRQGEIDFSWRGTISGDVKGTITFAMDGVARSTFLRNRIGLCVLHPMRECAGQPCVVEHTDGTREGGIFPKFISPHQPFVAMRSISHEVIPGVWAEVRFAGDVFEMEDQRNWTDASFKTYSTPLDLPYPVEIREGTRIFQSVTLTLNGQVPDPWTEPSTRDLVVTIGEEPVGSLPRIGLGMASHGQGLTGKELERLKALNLSHLRVDLHLFQADYGATLREAAVEAKALGIPLQVALSVTRAAGDELQSLAEMIERLRPSVCTWLIFGTERSTPERYARLAREHLQAHDPAAKIGGGTDLFFTELNRTRPPVHALDIVSYSLNPQVHAFDNTSLVETLETQAVTVAGARRFAGGLPLAIGPITLRTRLTPSATDPGVKQAPGELPSQVDVRQMSLFGAAWTAGSLKRVSESGVYSATYYETSGWRGVMETEVGSPLPGVFRSLPGSVFPLYHVLADVGEFAGGKVLLAMSSDPLRVDSLAVCKDGRLRVLLANLCPEVQQVTVRNLSTQVRVRRLDETNAEEAMLHPEEFRAHGGRLVETSRGTLTLTLLPYAVARIDCAWPQ